jgi:hypothetical protein
MRSPGGPCRKEKPTHPAPLEIPVHETARPPRDTLFDFDLIGTGFSGAFFLLYRRAVGHKRVADAPSVHQ